MSAPLSRVIRVGVLSEHATLAPLLSSVLGSEFTIIRASESATPQAIESLDNIDAVIVDFDRDSVFGREWARYFRRGQARSIAPVILLADDEGRREALQLVNSGAYGYVRKPPVVGELRAMLRSACEKCALTGELAAVRRQVEHFGGLDRLKGSSAPIQLVYKLVRKVANLDASVLITGESGTGKELIARAIHNTGNRAQRPFVAVSCGAIPESLIEAELFGHEKGAFTGSTSVREGYFEKAGDGTLFLDEIGELSPAIQVKLLRVLQERVFSRLGSTRTIPLRARIIFATHRDLEQMVAGGAFRQDLFYRIHVMNIVSPPLREHPEDVPQLVWHFLQHYSELYGKPLEGIEPEALALLQAYSWPGNVRELENAMQRAIIMAEGDSLQVADLPEPIQELDAPLHDGDAPSGSFERLLRDYKYKLATEAVQQCNGNKTLAAQTLSISRAYLHRLLRQAPVSDSNVTEFGLRRPNAEAYSGLPLASGA